MSSVLTVTLIGALCVGGVASADEVPTRQDVANARAATADAANDVAGIRAELALANQRAEQAWITSAQAAEQYNGATLAADEADRKAAAATGRLRTAESEAETQRAGYRDVLLDEYQGGGSLKNLSALLQADGVTRAQERMSTWHSYSDALSSSQARWSATATVASISRDQAKQASTQATELAEQAAQAKESAETASNQAAAAVEAIAAERNTLIARLARLQNVSVAVAAERQNALEAQAAIAAAEAAQAEALAQEQNAEPAPDNAPEQPQGPADEPPAPPSDQPTAQPSNRPSNRPGDQPSAEPTRVPSNNPGNGNATAPPAQPTTPPVTPKPPVTSAPSPAKGAAAAIAFAKQQLGEPYVWAKAGPSSWDCSGLTMGAWQAGGKSLPHWSVGQYRATTPIELSQLQAGDLLFWGSSGNSSSIYHVALYLGGGQMIHAPRPGKGVTIESMYYWRTPTFFTRP